MPHGVYPRYADHVRLACWERSTISYEIGRCPIPPDIPKRGSTAPNGSKDPSELPLVKKLYAGPRKGDWVEECPGRYDLVGEDGSTASAITLRYKMNSDELRSKPLKLHSVQVHSANLLDAIRAVFEGYPPAGFAEDIIKSKVQAPFTPFLHRWAPLLAQRGELSEKRTREELIALCAALEDEFGTRRDDFEKPLKQKLVTWRNLELLFELGDVVITKSGREEKASRIALTYYTGEVPDENEDENGYPSLSPPKRPLEFAMCLEYVDFDGTDYGIHRYTPKVPRFKGSRPVASLNITPLSTMPQQQELTERLTRRGQHAADLQSQRYMMYSGYVRFKPTREELLACGGGTPEKEESVEGRVLIDTEGYSKHYEPLHLAPTPQEMQSETEDISGTLSPMQLLLMAARVRGYKLVNKRWAKFCIDKISQVVWSEAAFDRLILPERRQRLLKALVGGNKRSQGDFDDIVHGKGKRLVILLSGPAGTGKTLAAEAVAEHLRLPIFAATTSDLHDTSQNRYPGDPAALEVGLRKNLALAARWGAVFLLDEADAFLEARSDAAKHTERDQRVAVFLRLLEYCKGVLVLTTNLQITFDPAFHSRIHLTLHYEPLDGDARAAVWQTFLGPSSLQATNYEQLGKYQLNGRRIKNIAKMARLLAQSESSDVRMEHLTEVLDIALAVEETLSTL